MDPRTEFLEWFGTTWREAEDALHAGDAGPRRLTWSENEPVTLFGAWLDASGSDAVRRVFDRLATSFAGSTSSDIELVAADASADLAYTVHHEITSATVNGVDSDYRLRVTQVYRREEDGWKVVHRHGDGGPQPPPGE